MAKLTKKQMIEEIEKAFRENPNMEVIVKDFPIRNTRWGLHGYCLCWHFDRIMVRPWSGANTYWCTDLMQLRKWQISCILLRCYGGENLNTNK